MASVTYGKCNFGQCIHGKSIMENVTEPMINNLSTFCNVIFKNCKMKTKSLLKMVPRQGPSTLLFSFKVTVNVNSRNPPFTE